MSKSSLAANKALVRRFTEELWAGNVSIVDELVAAGVLMGGIDHATRKANVLAALRAAPDLKLTIVEMMAEDDRVMFRWEMTRTHSQPIQTPLGLAPPTGKTVTASGITIHQVQDGMLVEDRFISDQFSFYKQLGVVPPGTG